ncbi:MAG: transcriptional regulator NrdR, partial [Lactiplantibacillus plantarum]
YVMEQLADIDEISYIRFASVYRQFKDMHVFLNELQDMMERDKVKLAKPSAKTTHAPKRKKD